MSKTTPIKIKFTKDSAAAAKADVPKLDSSLELDKAMDIETKSTDQSTNILPVSDTPTSKPAEALTGDAPSTAPKNYTRTRAADAFISQEEACEMDVSPHAWHRGDRDGNRRYFTANPYPAPKSNKKRKRDHDIDMDTEDGKRQKTLGTGKTPSSVLNEKYPGLVYNYSNMIGPPHKPKFEVTVVLPPPNGKEYIGVGQSKKLAKQNLAEIILAEMNYVLPQREENPELSQDEVKLTDVIGQKGQMTLGGNSVGNKSVVPMQRELDFTSDDLADIAVSGYPQPLQESIKPANFLTDNAFKVLLKNNVFEQPVCTLHAVLGSSDDIRYEFLPKDDRDPPHDPVFRVKLYFSLKSCVSAKQLDFPEQEFAGEGKSKKQAKANAAFAALSSLVGVECLQFLETHYQKNPMKNKKSTPKKAAKTSVQESPAEMESEDPDPDAEQYSLAFSQEVKKLVTEKHLQLVAGEPTYASQKVIAGVVLTLGSPLIENMHVVAVTTGNKCIAGEFLSDKGVSLNDCHAEVLATRCLRDFLYSQISILVTLKNGGSKEENEAKGFDVIVEEQKSISDGVPRFSLKPNVKFHLYISTSPCGDARVFSPKGLEVSPDEELEPSSPCAPGEELPHPHSNRVSRSLLRAKIEAGEGTIPVTNLIDYGVLQTWDGIMLGNALRTMSCSDKVCKWNVLGVQGALLSLFMDPIYYSSITLGSLHHPIHLKRAVFGRISSLPISDLPQPYRLNKPKLLMVADKKKRKVSKSPNHAVVWTCTWNSHEILSAPKGRCEPAGVTSRLCKRVAFLSFLKYYKNESGSIDNNVHISYDAAKNLAKDYQTSKKQLFDFLNEQGYGNWIAKPVEQDAFFI